MDFHILLEYGHLLKQLILRRRLPLNLLYLVLRNIQLLAEARHEIAHLLVLLVGFLGADVGWLHEVLYNRPDSRLKLKPIQLMLRFQLVLTSTRIRSRPRIVHLLRPIPLLLPKAATVVAVGVVGGARCLPRRQIPATIHAYFIYGKIDYFFGGNK